MTRNSGQFLLCIVIVCLLTFGIAVWCAADTETRVKVAFLYNFSKFVTWPPTAFDTPNAPIIIGIVGKNPFGDVINSLHDKKVKDRRIRVAWYRKMNRLNQCHILFVAVSQKVQMEKILNNLDQKPILTVSDIHGFASNGGCIELFRKNKKINFKINLAATQRAQLQISSQLLKLAEIINIEP